MASGTAPPITGTDGPQPPSHATEAERFIDKRLRQTRRQVKGVDLWAGLLTLAAAALAYLMAAAILDHWLIPGGLGFGSRLILFVILVSGAAFYGVFYLGPVILGRVNPVFAAQSIEQSRPSLKNSLINFLYLRRDRERIERDALSRGIYQALENKAAHDLEQIPPEVAVDRSRVIRLGYGLAAILGIGFLYLVLSPKSPLASFHRVLWPWADVKAPTRVTIDDVRPGSDVVYQGDVVPISARVSGLDEGEPVTLYYTTADGQSVDQAVPLVLPEGEYHYRCELPPGRFGLQQDVEYYLAAGDCRTQRFQLRVETALSILVDRVEYDYPEYTGIPDRVDQRIADLKAIEGTRVTIRATANETIARAFLDLDCDPRHALRMTADGSNQATVSFTLMLKPDDLTRPEHHAYQLRFADPSGRENRAPVRHRIEVLRDLAPEIRFVDPPARDVELPENGTLELQVRARDPDFALRHVALRLECSGRDLGIAPWLDRASGKPHEGPFERTYRFEPRRLGLKAGDRVIYWAEAEDNMAWDEDRRTTAAPRGASRPPNRAETPRRWITITPPDARWRPEQASGVGDASPDQPPEPAPQPGPDQPPEAPPQERQEAKLDAQGTPADPAADQQPEGTEPSEPQPRDPHGQEPSQQDQPGERGGESGATSSAQNDTGPSDSSQQGEGQGGTAAPTGQSPDGQTGPQSGGQPAPPREPVDGQTDPGEAFDQILQRIEEQEQKKEATGGSAPPQAGQPSTGGLTGDETPAEGQQPTGTEETSPFGGQPPAQGGTDVSGGDRPDEQRMPDNAPSPSETPGPSTDPQPGQGAQSRGPGEPTEQEPTGQGPETPEARGGDPQETKGEGGAGRTSNQEAGSPSPQEANQQRDKQLGEGDQTDPGEGEAPQSPSTSPKDSDSQGDTSGDRSGGGEQGGGQRAKQPGTGPAGTHTAAEQGGSQADQQGEGPTGTEAGDQVQADRPTGRPADQGEGPGFSQQNGPSAQRPGQQPQGQQPSPSGDPNSLQQEPTSGPETDSGQPTGHRPGSGPPKPGSEPGTLPGDPPPGTYQREDPNLQYARKAANLVLEHLEDQLADDQPDQELLDRLGWTKDDLRRFYDEWARMMREAAQEGERGASARQDLDKALRSLGLRAPGTELRGDRSGTDRPGSAREGLRIEPPPEWAEAYRAYRRGVATGNE